MTSFLCNFAVRNIRNTLTAEIILHSDGLRKSISEGINFIQKDYGKQTINLLAHRAQGSHRKDGWKDSTSGTSHRSQAYSSPQLLQRSGTCHHIHGSRKQHVENGDIVEYGDIGTLSPSFKSKIVEKGKEEFRPIIHITKPVVRLTPSKQYFTLKDVSYKRVKASTKKTKKKQISK